MAAASGRTLKKLAKASERLRLNPFEVKLFEFLTSVVAQEKLDLTLRVAGGWVRDKLLGMESDDIDIALDNSLGSEFAQRAASRFHGATAAQKDANRAQPHSATVSGPRPASGSQFPPKTHIIAANPDQSKHLETARVKLFDVWVDFVNLRAEEYANHSRIPTMRFGTPLEDALRRDLTINSLFYNLHTDEVEDYTGTGLSDLDTRTIRTPLRPLVTLLDDPLRALRAIRFGARLGYQYDPELVKAAQSADVQRALLTKVSRERYGKELHGILRTAIDPVQALQDLQHWKLLEMVFRPPDTERAVQQQPQQPGDETPSTAEMASMTDIRFAVSYRDVVQRAQSRQPATPKPASTDRGAPDQSTEGPSSIDWLSLPVRSGLFAALLWPVRNAVGVSGRAKKRRREPLVQSIVVALQFKGGQEVHSLQQSAVALLQAAGPGSAVHALASSGGDPSVPVGPQRELLGAIIRSAGGSLWPVALDVAEAVAAGGGAPGVTAEHVQAVRRWIDEQDLGAAVHLKPFLNGHQLMEQLAVPRGPLLSQLEKAQVNWRMSHPDGTEDQCKQFLLGHTLLQPK